MKKKRHKCRKEERTPASKPLKRCAEPGCPNLSPPGQRFCPPHVRHAPTALGTKRSDYHRANGWFYSSARWRKFRLWFLRRHPLCLQCKAPATQVDHIIPIVNGGAELDETNCQPLCASCHSKKTSLEQKHSISASASREGGVKTCGRDRRLPHVQLKKNVRKFWARGGHTVSNLTDRASFEGQTD